jgi:SpoU rRNA methylase family enzyme
MGTAAIIKCLELAAKYGVPAVLRGIEAMNKPVITLEDVDALEGLVKRPEEYFNEKPEEAA